MTSPSQCTYIIQQQIPRPALWISYFIELHRLCSAFRFPVDTSAPPEIPRAPGKGVIRTLGTASKHIFQHGMPSALVQHQRWPGIGNQRVWTWKSILCHNHPGQRRPPTRRRLRAPGSGGRHGMNSEEALCGVVAFFLCLGQGDGWTYGRTVHRDCRRPAKAASDRTARLARHRRASCSHSAFPANTRFSGCLFPDRPSRFGAACSHPPSAAVPTRRRRKKTARAGWVPKT